jgi:hypothetical protein
MKESRFTEGQVVAALSLAHLALQDVLEEKS